MNISTKFSLAALVLLIGCQGSLETTNADLIQPDPTKEKEEEKEIKFTGKIPTEDACKNIDVDPGPLNVRRMTDWELSRTLKYTFNVDLSAEIAAEVPTDIRAGGFTNTSDALITNISHIEAYEKISESVVEKIVDWNAFVDSHTTCTDFSEACQNAYIESLGELTFRRPLVANEVALFSPLFAAVQTENDSFYEGGKLVLRAMLQSPQFIFRLSNQEGTGDTKKVDAFELATRLSYLIWAAPPDAVLYDAAKTGQLSTDAEVEAQIDRMLTDEKAKEAGRRYVRDWLAIDDLDTLVRDSELYPEYTPALAAAMKEETLTFFDKLIWEDNAPMSSMLVAEHTYANKELAEFYGFANPQDGVQRYDLSSHPERIGFLTHASVLAVSGRANDPSLVERGLYVMGGLFCDSVVNTMDVVPELPVREAGKSQRFYAELRMTNPGCQGCHLQFDPFGMAMEKFDAVGAYVSNDTFGNELLGNGEFIDKSTGKPVIFADVNAFAKKIEKVEAVKDCMIAKPVQFTLGRILLQSDACMLSGIKADFDPGQHSYQDLIKRIAQDPYFQSVRIADVTTSAN